MRRAKGKADGKQRIAKAAAYAIGLTLAAVVAVQLLADFFPGAVESVRDIVGEYGLFGTFAVVLLGSTLLPFSVDVYFLASLQVFRDATALFVVAVIAATIGSFVNYFLALFLSEKWVEKQFGKKVLDEAHSWFNQWGGWALLLFGILPLTALFDPLTFVAGISRMEVRKFAVFIIASRVIHFAVLAASAGLLKL